MPDPPTTRFGLVLPIESDEPPDVANDYAQPLLQLEQLAAKYDQGNHSARPSASPANKGMIWVSTGTYPRRFVSTGTEWLPVAGPPPVVTSLPNAANSWDGMEIDLRVLVGDDGAVWRLIRNGNRWIVHGTGRPVVSRMSGGNTVAALAHEWYIHSMTVPFAGTYDAQFGAQGVALSGSGDASWGVGLWQGGSVVSGTWSTALRKEIGIGTPTDSVHGFTPGLDLAAGAVALNVNTNACPIGTGGGYIQLTPVSFPVAP